MILLKLLLLHKLITGESLFLKLSLLYCSLYLTPFFYLFLPFYLPLCLPPFFSLKLLCLTCRILNPEFYP